MKSSSNRKQKSKISKAPIIQAIAISLLILLIVLLGVFDLKLGAWFAPTSELKVDSAGIHFYSGWSDPSPLTWHLENANRVESGKISVTAIGYYNFPLPTLSGDYHLYCTGASGCDAGDWFRINLSTVPASPADTIISGWCSDGRGNFNTCSKASKYFPYSGGYGTPTDSMNGCNTCTGTRDINTVPGYDTSAKIVSAPPIPTPTPTPTIGLVMPPPTATSTPIPVSTTQPPPQAPLTTASPTETPVVTTTPQMPTQTGATPLQNGAPATKYEQESVLNTTNIFVVILIGLLAYAAYSTLYVKKGGK